MSLFSDKSNSYATELSQVLPYTEGAEAPSPEPSART